MNKVGKATEPPPVKEEPVVASILGGFFGRLRMMFSPSSSNPVSVSVMGPKREPHGFLDEFLGRWGCEMPSGVTIHQMGNRRYANDVEINGDLKVDFLKDSSGATIIGSDGAGAIETLARIDTKLTSPSQII